MIVLNISQVEALRPHVLLNIYSTEEPRPSILIHRKLTLELLYVVKIRIPKVLFLGCEPWVFLLLDGTIPVARAVDARCTNN